jgi:LVIVD repeat
LKGIRPLVVLATLCAMLAVPVAAQGHDMTYNAFGSAMMPLGKFNGITGAGFAATKNMHPMSFNAREGYVAGNFGTFGSDLAFWGDKAYQGSWDGFRILDISSPAQPIELVNYHDCAHPSGQGDMVVWDNILVRTWDANSSGDRTCDGEPVPNGFEGVHIFDVSNPADPDLLGSVDLACGSHTASGFPDVDNGRFILYSTPSSGSCDGIDVIEIPLDNPGSPIYHGLELAGTDATNANGFACHDTGIILGDAMKAACAGGIGFAVWSIGGEDGGSFTNPKFLYNKVVGHGVTVGHSAAFSWDGDTLIFGHEPGGGSGARCQRTGAPLNQSGTLVQTDDMKTLFFYDVASGDEIGKWTLGRDQTADENCTIHNYNVVPTRKGDILVHGSYQSGIGVLDFTDPANPQEVAYADPAPLPRIGSTGQSIQVAGDWSSYWYNGLIYQADISRGVMAWNLSDNLVAGAAKLSYLNPQTQEFTID